MFLKIEKDFLYNYCNYTDEILNNSKTNGAKVKKVSEILTELIKDRKKDLLIVERKMQEK